MAAEVLRGHLRAVASQVWSVCVQSDTAHEHANNLRSQGRRPRVHERQVSAEGITVRVYVVTCEVLP